jgi:hypothetical protein
MRQHDNGESTQQQLTASSLAAGAAPALGTPQLHSNIDPKLPEGFYRFDAFLPSSPQA